EALELLRPGRKGMAAGYRVRRHEAGIVPVVLVLRAGIAETCEDQHGLGSAGAAGLFLRRRFRGFLACLRTGSRRTGYGGDREVAVGDDRLDARWQLHGRDVDRIADLAAVEVDGDEFGDRVRGNRELHL